MAWRSAVRIELDEAERCELEARTRRRKILRADAMRAEIVLLPGQRGTPYRAPPKGAIGIAKDRNRQTLCRSLGLER